MASSGDDTNSGLFGSERRVLEAVQSLNGLFLQYRQCVRDHKMEKEKFQGLFDVWVEETMKAAEEQGIDSDEQQPILVVEERKEETVDDKEVVSDVVLQHKQGLLEEWGLAEEVWQLQAETWAEGCTICRIRGGKQVSHDWRDCGAYAEDRDKVEEAHKEVEKGILSGSSVEEMYGGCEGCEGRRTDCWLQIKDGAEQTGCKYGGVVTESVAGILAIGPKMVRQWEEREGGRQGAGVEGVEGFAGVRFGGLAVCRVWRAFGWAGIWDIREAKVGEVRQQYQGRLQQMERERLWKAKGFLGKLNRENATHFSFSPPNVSVRVRNPTARF